MDTAFVPPTYLANHVGHTPELTENCSEENRICTRSVLNALQRLCVPPSVCLSVTDDSYAAHHGVSALNAQTRRMDDVLRTNRRVLELVSRVLQCSCAIIPSVQLILVVVCDRVFTWYRAMLRDDEDRMMFEQAPTTSSPNIEYDHGELVLAMPITMGNFSVDTSMQVHIRNQLVIDEMRGAENVIHQFAARVQEAQCQSSPAHRQQIYEIINSLLRDQLQAQTNIIYELAIHEDIVAVE